MRAFLCRSVNAIFFSAYLSSNIFASSVEISGIYNYNYDYNADTFVWNFNADTLLVVGDCQLNSFVFKPGTVILFKGDFLIDLTNVKSFGKNMDSITFCGNLSTYDTTKQGTIIDLHNPSQPQYGNISCFEKTNFINLKIVDIQWASRCSFVNCSYINNGYHSSSNKMKRNNTIRMPHEIYSCQFIENQNIFYSFGRDRIDTYSLQFTCINSLFYRNSTGLTNLGDIGGLLNISNCQFIENGGNALTCNTIDREDLKGISANIQFNKFYKNKGNNLVFNYTGIDFFSSANISYNKFIENEGLAISANNYRNLIVHDNLFVKNSTSSGAGSINYLNNGISGVINIMNNTFVSNKGETYGIMEINSENPSTKVMISNNIFWNNTAALSDYAIGLNFVNSPNEFYEICLTNSVARDTNKIALITGSQIELTQKNNFNLSPEFADTLNGNYRLSMASPYIDAGAETSYTEADLDQSSRVFGRAIDIGAYEYIPAGNPDFIYLTKDTIVCLNDSITLLAYSNDHYLYNWYKDGEHLINKYNDTLTIPSFSINDTGYYRVSISNQTEIIWSDPIHLASVLPPSIIDYTPTLEVCRNDTAEFFVSTQSYFEPLYSWFNYQGTMFDEYADRIQIQAEHNDTIMAVAKTICGSDTSSAMLLTLYETPLPDLGADTCLYPVDSILLDAGAFEYYLWSTGSTERTIYCKAGDTIWVFVNDINSCIGIDTIVIGLQPYTTFRSQSVSDFILYPNPVEDELFILANNKINVPYIINIFSRDGRLILKRDIVSEDIKSLYLGHLLEPGYYLLQIISNTFIGTGCFIME